MRERVCKESASGAVCVNGGNKAGRERQVTQSSLRDLVLDEVERELG